ncbi:MAG: DUF2231 domain-containing protein [Pirellulales bacterium]
MNFKHLLQGQWLGHPLHPVFVSLPVALWPTAMVCDLLSAAGAAPEVFGRMALVSLLLGLAGAMLSIPTGLADWWEIQREKRAWKLGLYHMLLNVLATIIWTTNLGMRFASSDVGNITLAPLALSIVGTLLIGGSTWLGGRMVYDQGAGIARTSKKRWRRIAKAAGARLAEEKD